MTMNIVIMAGGGGTRLWPLSRKSKPKQFIDLGTGKTLLEHTYDRARTLAEPANIFVATTEEYRDQVNRLLPDVPLENMFYEPFRRDTGPAFAAAAIQLKLRNRSDQPTIFMWSDHVFTVEDAFLADLKKIPQLVEENPDAVVIIGHTPVIPETGLGYIELGDKHQSHDNVFKVSAFKEKPDHDTAEQYVAAGNYMWNMAYVSCQPDYLLKQLRQYQPELMKGVDTYEQALQGKDQARANATYGKLPKISIDYALLEHAPNILAVTGNYGWSDVGNWAAVHDVFGVKGDHMPHGHHVHVDSKNNYIYNATDKTVSLIGLEDTIAVITDDAVLVTKKEDAHKVKDVVAKLEAENNTELL